MYSFKYLTLTSQGMNAEDEDIAKAIALSMVETKNGPSKFYEFPVDFWHYNGLHPPGLRAKKNLR